MPRDLKLYHRTCCVQVNVIPVFSLGSFLGLFVRLGEWPGLLSCHFTRREQNHIEWAPSHSMPVVLVKLLPALCWKGEIWRHSLNRILAIVFSSLGVLISKTPSIPWLRCEALHDVELGVVPGSQTWALLLGGSGNPRAALGRQEHQGEGAWVTQYMVVFLRFCLFGVSVLTFPFPLSFKWKMWGCFPKLEKRNPSP